MKGSAAPELLAEVADYYTARLGQFGETPRGVDWNGEAGQTLRFAQLCKILPDAGGFSVADLGCGYGALHDYLAARHGSFSYLGVDVSLPMVEAARRRHTEHPGLRFLQADAPDLACDYVLASGIFNVRLSRSEAEWRQYLENTLDVLNRTSLRGFAFNCLTSYSDAERMRTDLFYADPCVVFDFCKRRYARDVALLHDYGLYEFTILVKKTP